MLPVPPPSLLAARGAGAARALRVVGHSVAAVEATSAGLVAACLQAVPRASRFWQGGVTIYSAKAAAALLPLETRRALGKPADNYRSPEAYVASKETFTAVLAQHFRAEMGVDWVVAESGATSAASLPVKLRSGGAFTVVAVAGPRGFRASRVVRPPASNSREGNMFHFADAALELLEESVELWQGEHGEGRSNL